MVGADIISIGITFVTPDEVGYDRIRAGLLEEV